MKNTTIIFIDEDYDLLDLIYEIKEVYSYLDPVDGNEYFHKLVIL